MKNVFLGELKNKTRIMATHKTKLLRDMDRIILMKDVKIVLDAGFDEVKDTQEYKEYNEHENHSSEEQSTHQSNFENRQEDKWDEIVTKKPEKEGSEEDELFTQ